MKTVRTAVVTILLIASSVLLAHAAPPLQEPLPEGETPVSVVSTSTEPTPFFGGEGIPIRVQIDTAQIEAIAGIYGVKWVEQTPELTYRTLAQDNGNENFTVRLKSREFVPVPGVGPAVERQQQTASPGERIHVLVQFWQIPSDAERVTLENAGVELLAYVPANTWFVSMPAGLSLQSNVLAGVRWIGAIQPEDRMAPTLRAGVIGPHATHDDGTVSLDVRFFADVTNTEVTQLLSRYNGVIETKAPEFHRFTVRVDPGAIDALANEDGVQWITEAAPPKTTYNDGSRARTNVDTVQAAPYDLSGSGVDLGIWDGGRVDNHVDFSGRLTVVDSALVGEHATHVAGTMAGDGSNSANQGGSPLQWRGMAPGADIISYYWDNNLTDHNGAINTYGIELSQNSWGYEIATFPYNNCYLYGDYDADAPDYDDIITGLYGRRISVIFAAGNERDNGDCGMSGIPPYINYANIGPPATAKNVIAVGATNSNDDSMTDFSSWGPLDDGRIKPDVVAPGCESTGEGYIHSTLPGNAYGAPGWCGTSMAAPAVSGIVGLLIEQYRTSFGGDPLPSTVKALLIQTAVDLDDGTSYYNPGPDYASGYGRVDAQAAVDEVIAQHIREDQVPHGQTDSFTVTVSAGTPSLKFTLVWDDEPGAVNANPALVNNLDLVLVEPNGTTTHLPWVLDPANPSNNATTGTDSVNNVEQVQVDNPTAGTWEVRVIGTNVPVGLQQYSLVGQTFTSPALLDRIYYFPLILKSYPPPPLPSLANGDFEAGPDGSWREFSTHGWPLILHADDLIVTPHGGSWAVWLGGGYNETAYIEQNVTVPSSNPYLSYYHWIASQDICGYDYDYGWVKINGSTVRTYELCDGNDTNGWDYETVDLSSYAGQTVELQIGMYADIVFNSNWFIDDVAFQTSPSAIDDVSRPPIATPSPSDPSDVRPRQ